MYPSCASLLCVLGPVARAVRGSHSIRGRLWPGGSICTVTALDPRSFLARWRQPYGVADLATKSPFDETSTYARIQVAAEADAPSRPATELGHDTVGAPAWRSSGYADQLERDGSGPTSESRRHPSTAERPRGRVESDSPQPTRAAHDSTGWGEAPLEVSIAEDRADFEVSPKPCVGEGIDDHGGAAPPGLGRLNDLVSRDRLATGVDPVVYEKNA